MRVTETKTLNTKLPIQGRADEINTLLDSKELLFKDSPQEYIKAKLYHLDGQQSEIVTIMPFYTSWGEPYEEAAMQLKQYVYYLAKYWLKIEKFEIEFGRRQEDGTLKQSIKYATFEIPLNMVFEDGKDGKWISLEDAKASRFK